MKSDDIVSAGLTRRLNLVARQVWRDAETAKHAKRDQWDATLSKKDAIETSRRRAKTYQNR